MRSILRPFSCLLIALGTGAAVLTSLGEDTATASGRVFLDADADGSFDDGEELLGGILVSNGREVVKTDEDGGWELPASDDVIFFVIKPGDYDLPVDAQNKPQFYYIHKPAGSPQLEFAGVAPTGSLPESIDFALLPGKGDAANGEGFSALFFGDPQPYSIQEVDFFARDIVNEVAGATEHAFGAVLGDIVGDDLDLFDPLNDAVAQIGIPFFYVYGNHDMNFDADSDETADETFERVYGPATYAFSQGGVHFIVVDDVHYPNEITDSKYVGAFSDEQLEFMKNLLAHLPTDDQIVTLMHIPFWERSERDTFVDEDREAFFALFENHPHTLSLSAHTHTQGHKFFGPDEGWPHREPEHFHHHYNVGTTSGSWWRGAPDERGIPHTTMRDGTPNGYAIIHFEEDGYVIDYRVANAGPEKRMGLFAPRVMARAGWTNGLLAVNFYNGTEKAKVEYRVIPATEMGKKEITPARDWRDMQHNETVDPGYMQLVLERHASSRLLPGRDLPLPTHSSHLWTTRLPGNLRPGTYVIEVRVTDMFGRTFEDATSYRIEER